jgi:hypothetical protein
MSFRKKYLAPIIVAMVLLGGFSTLVYLEGQQEDEIIINGKETVCVAYDEGKRMIKIKYAIDGKEYNNTIVKEYSNIEDGEEFVLTYLPSDPESVVVQFDQPVLSESYNYQETACLSVVKELSIVKFIYEVGGERFERRTLRL